MTKFDYKKELERYFKSIGGNEIYDVNCEKCMFDDFNFENIECRCGKLKYADECVELVQKWSEENPREIDWMKVPADTKVLVKDCEEEEWIERYYGLFMPSSRFNHLCFDGNQKRKKMQIV